MTDTLVTSAPSVIVATLRRMNRYSGNPLDDTIWGRGTRASNLNTFNNWIAQRDSWALAQLAEAHALDVLHDAYKLNNALTMLTEDDFTLAQPSPFAHIDAMIHEEFPGAIPDAKLGKLRALAQERLDLRQQVESYRVQLRNELDTGKDLRAEIESYKTAPITDGHDPRIEGLLRVAAQEAIDREYCEVYDQIASVAGFPTREELGMSKRDYMVTITRVMSLTPDEAANLSVADVTGNQRACSLDYEELED